MARFDSTAPIRSAALAVLAAALLVLGCGDDDSAAPDLGGRFIDGAKAAGCLENADPGHGWSSDVTEAPAAEGQSIRGIRVADATYQWEDGDERGYVSLVVLPTAAAAEAFASNFPPQREMVLSHLEEEPWGNAVYLNGAVDPETTAPSAVRGAVKDCAEEAASADAVDAAPLRECPDPQGVPQASLVAAVSSLRVRGESCDRAYARLKTALSGRHDYQDRPACPEFGPGSVCASASYPSASTVFYAGNEAVEIVYTFSV